MGQYIRHAVAPIEEIISAMLAGSTKHTYNGLTFNISSLRLRTFCRDAGLGKLKCAGCGLDAKFFAIEAFARNSDNKSVHANLYGVREDGKEVLFTHDHILARALGGEDTLKNSQTMCGPCNWAKGAQEGRQVNQARFVEKLSPKAKIKAAQVAAKQKNPTSLQDIEVLLNLWAANKDLESFTRRIDDWLYKHGWKRRRLKNEISAGNITFTLHPVRD